MTFMSMSDFTPIFPELILILTALLVLMVDLVGTDKKYNMTAPLLTIGGFCIAIVVGILLFGKNYVGFFDTVLADEYSILFETIT